MDNYIDKLKQAVNDAFKDASEKSAIDQMVSINSLIAQVESENESLCAKNKELIAAYKEAVIHPGIKKEPEQEVTQVPVQEMPDFDKILADAIAKEN